MRDPGISQRGPSASVILICSLRSSSLRACEPQVAGREEAYVDVRTLGTHLHGQAWEALAHLHELLRLESQGQIEPIRPFHSLRHAGEAGGDDQAVCWV
jgi:hypothetical protein